jgi:hypothetical protein
MAPGEEEIVLEHTFCLRLTLNDRKNMPNLL